MPYSQALLRYFYNMEHAGSLPIEDPAIRMAELGRIEHGDVLRLYLRCERNQITSARFQAYGSVALLGLAEFACLWLEGKSCGEAKQLKSAVLLQSLDLSSLHTHAATLIQRVVQKTIEG